MHRNISVSELQRFTSIQSSRMALNVGMLLTIVNESVKRLWGYIVSIRFHQHIVCILVTLCSSFLVSRTLYWVMKLSLLNRRNWGKMAYNYHILQKSFIMKLGQSVCNRVTKGFSNSNLTKLLRLQFWYSLHLPLQKKDFRGKYII
jgi:hypothetical protein